MLAGATDQIEAARADEGLVEVVDVVEEIAVVGPVGAEVLQVEVAADEDRGADVGRTEARPVGGEQVVCAPEERERIFRHPPEFEPDELRIALAVERDDLVDDR